MTYRNLSARPININMLKVTEDYLHIKQIRALDLGSGSMRDESIAVRCYSSPESPRAALDKGRSITQVVPEALSALCR
jgi:hypothetical protein